MGWNLMNKVGIEIDLIHGKVFLNNFHVLRPLTRLLIHLAGVALASTEIRPALVVVVVATKKR